MAVSTQHNSVWQDLAQRVSENNDAGAAVPDSLADEFVVQVRRICAVYVKLNLPPGDAEDLTQHIVLKLWQALPSFRGERAGGSLYCFVQKAVLNAVKTYWDRKRRHPEIPASQIVQEVEEEGAGVSEVLERGEPIGVPPATPEEVLVAEDLRRRLLAALAGLPERQRQAFLLQHVSGLSFQRVGVVLGVSEDAAKMASARAAKVLREAYDGYERGSG
jgi:RNA polymerase sigma factor (sigma-70 family)